jgi:hypothetical protein
MTTITIKVLVWVFIGVFLSGVFGLLPCYICCSHNDSINHDRRLILDETPNQP